VVRAAGRVPPQMLCGPGKVQKIRYCHETFQLCGIQTKSLRCSVSAFIKYRKTIKVLYR